MGGKLTKAFSFHGNNKFNYESVLNPDSEPYTVCDGTLVDFDTRVAWQSKYGKIQDNYETLEEVKEALIQAGLESSNLIVGIDFTKSNEWTGALSFNNRNLHHLGDSLNPYEQATSIIGRTLSGFDEDNLIPCYGFGDVSTHDQEVFSFYPEDKPCHGFEEVLGCYRAIVPQIRLAGPTSFAPIIEAATGIVERTGGLYHVLVIIADGQVTRSVDSGPDQLSCQEFNTMDAIVKASEYPLSIVLVGVGDGPWDMMPQFSDNNPARAFDNFQFVNFTEIMSRNVPMSMKEAEFALSALKKIPAQYKATIDLQLLSKTRGAPRKIPLRPLLGNCSSLHPYAHPNQNLCPYYMASTPSGESYVQNRNCSLCLYGKKDLAFGCGHRTCCDCGKDLSVCPVCHLYITKKIRLDE